jgi:hypothetical protein
MTISAGYFYSIVFVAAALLCGSTWDSNPAAAFLTKEFNLIAVLTKKK